MTMKIRTGTLIIGIAAVGLFSTMFAMMYHSYVTPNYLLDYNVIVPAEKRNQAAEFIVRCSTAANPHSDEEGEDLVAQCEQTANNLFGERKALIYISVEGNNYSIYCGERNMPSGARHLCP